MKTQISLHPPQPQAAAPRHNLPASSTFSRQKSAADERFLEQNPWANAQHPAHNQLQRQRSAMSRPESPLITPAPQRRVIDLTALQESASTIPENPSSSMKATPATGEQHSKASRTNARVASNAYLLEMLAKAPGLSAEDQASHIITKSETPREHSKKISTLNDPSRLDIHVKPPSHQSNSINLPAHLESTPNSKVNTDTSPTFPTIKAEEAVHSLHQSPLLHYYQTPTPVSAGVNGQVHRLGA